MSESLKDRVTRGVAWNGAAKVATRGFQAVVTVILAHLLSPADFGIVGMTAVFTGFVAMFSELGMSAAIVQAGEVDDEQLNTVFWFILAAAAATWAVSAAGAGAVAAFFKQPLLAAIVPVSAAGFVIGALNTVPAALLSRRLDFRSIALANIWGAFAYGAASITAAMAGWGPWSLVAGGLLMAAARTVVLCVKGRWLPGLAMTWRRFKPMLRFGVKTVGVSFADYARANIDYLVIGRFIGAAPLGQYTIAFKLADFPRARLTPIFTEVAFPAFSSVKDEAERVRNAYLRGVRLVSLTVFPLLAGAAALAYELIVVVYGGKWRPAVFPARVLLLMGMLLAVGQIASTVLLSKGRPGLQLMMSAGYTLAVGAFVLLALPYGIDGVAVAVSAGTVLYFAVLLRFAHREIGVPIASYGEAVRPALQGCAALTVALVVLGRFATGPLGLSDAAWLLLGTAVGAIAYLIGIGRDGRGEAGETARRLLVPLRRWRERRRVGDVPLAASGMGEE